MRMFEMRVPFFFPLWRRIVVIAICVGWAGFELISGEPIWAILFVAAGATAAWQFFFSGWPDNRDSQGDTD